MKNRNKLIASFIIPVLFFLSANIFKEYQGPYYTNSQYDPSYAYLISSLNLSQMSGIGVGHIDHPGTPVQVIGAAVIRVSYYFSSQDADMVTDVLKRPEEYMSKIFITLLFINCIGLYILGIAAYKVYSEFSISLLLQLTPFTSLSILTLTTLIRPENFIIFIVCIFLSVILFFIKDKSLNPKKNLLYLTLLGIICGLGIATKLTFLPLVLIPFMMFRGIKNKLLFLLSVSVSFVIFVIPAISSNNISYFTEWIYNLFIYSKKYGKGEPTIIDSNSFLYKIRLIIRSEWIFDIAYFMTILSLILSLIPRIEKYLIKFKNTFLNKIGLWTGQFHYFRLSDIKFRLIAGIFLTMTMQILIVAKHYGEFYMFPVLLLSVFSIILSVSEFHDPLRNLLTQKRKNMIYTSLIISIGIFGAVTIYSHQIHLKEMTAESDRILKYMDEYSDHNITISTHHVPDLAYALFTGTAYAISQRERYDSILFDRYPKEIFYFDKDCFSFSSDKSLVSNTLKTVDTLYLLCGGEDYANDIKMLFNLKYGITDAAFEKKFTNGNGEMIYEIIFH